MRRRIYAIGAATIAVLLLTATAAMASRLAFAPPTHATRASAGKASASSQRKHHHKTKHGRRTQQGHTEAASASHTAVATGTVLLGDQTVESSIDLNGPGMAEAFPFTAGASGSTASLSVYVDSHNSATKLIAGVYGNSGAAPSSLIATGTLASPKAGAWNVVTLGSVALTAGHQYWVAILGTGGMLYFRDRDGGPCNSVSSASSSLQTLAASWTTGASWNTCPVSAYVSASSTVVTPAPTDTAAPTLSGTPQQGQTLTSSTGTWANAPTSYQYAWEDCATSGSTCSTIAGATSATYTLQASDVGQTIRSQVTASNAGGSASATSAVSAVVSSSSAAPTASFTFSPSAPVPGSSVQFNASASTCAAGGCTYTWADDPPSGGTWPLGTGQTMAFTFQNVGTKYVTLTVTDALGRTATVEHDVAVAAASVASPADAAPPTISGTAQAGQTLTASTGTWTGSPTTYSYQWEDCNTSGSNCVAVSGATASTDTLASGDVGQTVRVQVTAANGGGSASATSTETATVAAAPSASPVSTALPVVSGTATVGQTLTASPGSWTNSPTSYAYQWQLCSPTCANIAAATAAGYTLTSADQGDTLDVVVTATSAGGTGVATSATTSPVTAGSGGGGGGGGVTCNYNANTSTFGSDVSAASAGQTICLASGDYGSWGGASEASPGITITAASGATVNFSGGFNFSLGNVKNITVDGTADGGTMSVGGGDWSGSTTSALNILIQNVSFTGATDISSPANSNITFNRDTFDNMNDTQYSVPYPTCKGDEQEPARLHFSYGSSTPSGITVENSLLDGGNDDGIQTGVGFTAKDNVFAYVNEWYAPLDCQHTDPIQGVGAQGMVVEGNLLLNDADGIVDYDDSTQDVIENNACYGIQQQDDSCISLYGDLDSTVSHNSTWPSDPIILIDHKSSDRTGTGTILENNDGGGPQEDDGSSFATNANNLFSGASSPNINGTPTFAGGADPTTWAGFELTSGSAGHDGSTDGTDVGVQASAGGPPTGDGTEPVNTGLPSISGTAGIGDTLTAANGSWNITTTIPSGFSYQWERCNSSGGSCSPIITSDGTMSTYQTTSADSGDMIRVVVTATNANGTVSATSAAFGTV